jgi:hypothetical protein
MARIPNQLWSCRQPMDCHYARVVRFDVDRNLIGKHPEHFLIPMLVSSGGRPSVLGQIQLRGD